MFVKIKKYVCLSSLNLNNKETKSTMRYCKITDVLHRSSGNHYLNNKETSFPEIYIENVRQSMRRMLRDQHHLLHLYH